jgi:hypothetical protein
MVAFQSTAMTKQVAHMIGALYIIYGFFNMRASTLLFSLAVGLIVLGFINSMELAVAATIISGLLLKMFFKGYEGFQTTDPVDVEKRLAGMRSAAPAGMPLSTAAAAQPVLSGPLAEGFSDVTPDAQTASGSTTGSGSASASSASAPAPAPSASGSTTAGFTGATGGDGIFKLGQLPSEAAGGPHLDASSTMMNAMQALKPDQIKSLTDDTRQLLDTQKSLMGLLENMKPMLKDGASLINTFSGMMQVHLVVILNSHIIVTQIY